MQHDAYKTKQKSDPPARSWVAHSARVVFAARALNTPDGCGRVSLMLTASAARTLCAVFVVVLAISLAGCSMVKTKSKDDALKDIAWTYEQDAIELAVRTQPDLNQWRGQPHTVLMLVAQIEDPSAFESHIASPDKLAALLLAETAPDGLLTLQKHFVEPDASRTFRMARVEKARYVALAIGYQHLDPSRSTRLYQIGADLDYSGLVLREYQASPSPLHIQVLLGAESIQDSLTVTPAASPPAQPTSGLVVPHPPATSQQAAPEPATEVIRIPSSPPAPGTN